MEITTEQKDELKTIVSQNPQGLSFNELYKKATSFSDESELSCGIHECMQEGICVKIHGSYYPKNNIQVSPSSLTSQVTEEIKEILSHTCLIETNQAIEQTTAVQETEHKVVQAHTKRTVVAANEAPKTKVPPCGNLRRSSTKGVIAMALYRVRGDVLTRKELNLLFSKETSSGAIYQAILSLVTVGMIEKAGNEYSNMSYRWTDQFGYPFPHHSPEDKHIVPFKDYQEFLKFKVRTLEPTTQEIAVLVKTGNPDFDAVYKAPPEILHEISTKDVLVTEAERTVRYKPISEALSMIRASISHHEAQIAMLRNLENKLEFVTL